MGEHVSVTISPSPFTESKICERETWWNDKTWMEKRALDSSCRETG